MKGSRLAGCDVFRERFGAAQIDIESIPRRRRLQQSALGLGLVYMSGQNRRDGADDFVLKRENVSELPVVTLCPEVCARCSVDQLGTDANAVTASTNAAFQHVAHAEYAPDFTD